MQKAGVPQFDFETFKSTYDANPQLQDLVKFGPKGVSVYSDSSDKLPQSNQKNGDDDVAQMAKRATKLGD